VWRPRLVDFFWIRFDQLPEQIGGQNRRKLICSHGTFLSYQCCCQSEHGWICFGSLNLQKLDIVRSLPKDEVPVSDGPVFASPSLVSLFSLLAFNPLVLLHVMWLVNFNSKDGVYMYIAAISTGLVYIMLDSPRRSMFLCPTSFSPGSQLVGESWVNQSGYFYASDLFEDTTAQLPALKFSVFKVSSKLRHLKQVIKWQVTSQRNKYSCRIGLSIPHVGVSTAQIWTTWAWNKIEIWLQGVFFEQKEKESKGCARRAAHGEGRMTRAAACVIDVQIKLSPDC
jgi:hypothetical protein